MEADLRFHLGLLALAGNDHLVQVVRDLRRRSRLYGLTALVEQGRLEASAEEHLEILDALLAGDETAVREVMTRHLGHVRGLWAAPGPDPVPPPIRVPPPASEGPLTRAGRGAAGPTAARKPLARLALVLRP